MKAIKKKVSQKILFISIFVILFSLSLIITDYKLNIFERVFKDIVLFIESPFVRNETKSKCRTFNEYQEEYNQIKKIVDISNSLVDKDYVYVSIINRNLNLFYDTITINKGKKEGIAVNDAVTYGNNLIGKVTNVSNYNATVRLLTSNASNNKVSIKVKNEDIYVYGLLNGYIDDYYIVDNIDNQVSKGNVILTTGYGDSFPSNLVVGTVEMLKKDNFGLSSIAYIKPIIDINNITYLTVLKRKI